MIDLTQCRTLLLFGGSFDPPHRAHVELPKVVMRQVHADAVAYIPCAVQPLKQDQAATAGHHRLRMLQLALADEPNAVILTDELDRADDGQPSYTVDTLERLRQRLGDQVRLRLLIGVDQLRLFDRWKSPQRIVELAEPVVMGRPPEDEQTLADALPPGYDLAVWRSRFVKAPQLDISSTMIRQRVRDGLPITGLVSPAVERYILEQGLYR